VLFNKGYLVPFKFDGKTFQVERVEPEALEKFRLKKEAEDKKLNRKKTDAENKQDMAEMDELPKIYEDIKVVYRKDPTSPIVDLVLYVNEIINA
jgi:RNA-splicing ligase RtcB